MRYLIMFLAMILCLANSKVVVAQHCLSFSYDDNGNRNQRSVCDCTKDDNNSRNEDDMAELNEFDEDALEGDFKIFPNPTEGKFFIIVNNDKQQKPIYIKMYDISGFIVLSNTLTGYRNEIDICDMVSGAYLLKVIRGDEVRTKLIIKR